MHEPSHRCYHLSDEHDLTQCRIIVGRMLRAVFSAAHLRPWRCAALQLCLPLRMCDVNVELPAEQGGWLLRGAGHTFTYACALERTSGFAVRAGAHRPQATARGAMATDTRDRARGERRMGSGDLTGTGTGTGTSGTGPGTGAGTGPGPGPGPGGGRVYEKCGRGVYETVS